MDARVVELISLVEEYQRALRLHGRESLADDLDRPLAELRNDDGYGVLRLLGWNKPMIDWLAPPEVDRMWSAIYERADSLRREVDVDFRE